MSSVVTAAIGALLGIAAILAGLNFHIGTWFIDGTWAYVLSAISGAVVALIVRAALRRQFGWP